VGTVFTVEDETGRAWFRITAVGEERVVGRQIASQEFGFSKSPCRGHEEWITADLIMNGEVEPAPEPPPKTDEELMATPTADGAWLFREGEGRWWRLTYVSNGGATGSWIDGTIPLDRLRGEWRAPSDEERRACEADSMGRLLSASD
jgi:hypothetical protein